MKINQVEERVGITKKNIRFYEDAGLLSPNRNPNNGYREYDEADVDRLLKIKLLRKLAIPIEDIKKIYSGEVSLKDGMNFQINSLEKKEAEIDSVISVCKEINNSENDIDSLNPGKYLVVINRIEKGGVLLLDVKKTDVKKKKFSALISGLVMILVICSIIGICLWANTEDPMPFGVMLFLLIPLAVVIIGIIIAITQRFKEIKEGEEDAAGNY